MMCLRRCAIRVTQRAQACLHSRTYSWVHTRSCLLAIDICTHTTATISGTVWCGLYHHNVSGTVWCGKLIADLFAFVVSFWWMSIPINVPDSCVRGWFVAGESPHQAARASSRHCSNTGVTPSHVTPICLHSLPPPGIFVVSIKRLLFGVCARVCVLFGCWMLDI